MLGPPGAVMQENFLMRPSLLEISYAATRTCGSRAAHVYSRDVQMHRDRSVLVGVSMGILRACSHSLKVSFIVELRYTQAKYRVSFPSRLLTVEIISKLVL